MSDDLHRSDSIRARQFWDAFSQLTGTGEQVPAAKLFADKARSAITGRAEDISSGDVAALARLADEALKEAEKEAAAHNPDNPFAQYQALEAARAQMRAMLQAVHLPEELASSFDYIKLLKDLSPKDARGEENEYRRRTAMQGKVRAGVLERQVHESIEQADKAATLKRTAAAQKAAADQVSTQVAQKSFLKAVKDMRKKKRAQQAEVSLDDTQAAPVVSRGDAEELAEMALETMRTLREEVAPRWAPSQQPWLLNAADKEVFETCLAVIPKELFEETAAFAGIQDLRRGQGAFTTRAADKAQDAVRRGK